MLNLIKMNFYYCIKCKIMWVLFGISVILIAALYGMTDFNPDSSKLLTFIEMIKGEDALILTTVFTISLVGAKFKTGYIKNFGNRYSHRKLFIADLLSVGVFTVLLFAVTLLATAICSSVNDISLRISDILEILPFTGAQIVLHIAVMSIMIFVINLVENVTICMAMGISYICLISIIFWNAINTLVEKSFSTFSVLDYVLTHNVAMLSYKSSSQTYVRLLLLSFVVIIVFCLLNILLTKRKDIC